VCEALGNAESEDVHRPYESVARRKTSFLFPSAHDFFFFLSFKRKVLWNKICRDCIGVPLVHIASLSRG
jgi:hypothetical protein